MSAHESFEELCALAVTGDLEPDEFKKLGEHLYECESCRASYRDFHAILEQGLPALEHRRASGWLPPRFGMKKRFAARASKEGVLIAQPKQRSSRMWWILVPATAVLLVGLTNYEWRADRAGEQQQSDAANRIAFLSRRIAELEQRMEQREPASDPSQLDPLPKPESELSGRELELNRQVGLLRRSYESALSERGQLEERVSSLSTEMEELRGDSRTGRNEIERLQLNLQDAQAALARSNRDLESLRNGRAADASIMAEQRARLDEFSATIRQQAASLERERELLVAGKDIRDLMGARNLRIVDVEDDGISGKVRPLAGRIFYTKDTSLIFYAYDLQNKGTVSKVDFQVWGKREGRSQPPRSLGILYTDDAAQNRWMLKFEDPTVLAQIDQVFVTVEPRGGSRQPTGKQLLTAAFMNEVPNHP